MNAKKILFFASLFFTSLGVSFAAQNYFGDWGDIVLRYDDHQWIYYLKTQERIYFDDPQQNELMIRPAIAYRIHSAAIAWLGYDFHQSLYDTSIAVNTIWEQMQWRPIAVARDAFLVQTRLDQRFFDQSSQVALRLREMPYVKIKNIVKNNVFYPVIYDELFFNLNHPSWVSNKTWSQNRVFAGIDIPYTANMDILLGYLNRAIFNTHTTLVDHLIYVSLDFNFGTVKPVSQYDALL